MWSYRGERVKGVCGFIGLGREVCHGLWGWTYRGKGYMVELIGVRGYLL